MKFVTIKSEDLNELLDSKNCDNETEINSGVYDPGIFKAIFLAGGPGSGKSFVSRSTINWKHGLKVVNSDDIFEADLKRAGKDADMTKMTKEEYDEVQKIRERAKEKTNIKMKYHLRGKLGLIIDGTGKDIEKISKKKKMLEDLGYDTYMIVVNTTLPVAKERNAERKRKVAEELVEKYWNAVQTNLKSGYYKNLFGNNFAIVENSSHDNKDVIADVKKQVDKFIKTPIKSPIAKTWINDEIQKRKEAGERIKPLQVETE